MQRLQDELRGTFPDIESIKSKELMQCTYLNAVVEEGLRIYPPAGAAHLSRIVPKGGVEMAGRFIPGGVKPCSRSRRELCTNLLIDPCVCPSLVDSSQPKCLPHARKVYT